MEITIKKVFKYAVVPGFIFFSGMLTSSVLADTFFRGG